MELLTKMEGTERTVTVIYDFGDNLADMRAKLIERGAADPDQVIFSHARANMKVACRALVKTCMKKDGENTMSDDQIQDKISKWAPGVAVESTPQTREKKISAFEREFDKMSPEDKAKYLEELKARLGM